jgi:hypothetical protein
VRYRDYLRLEGTCSVVLGAVLALVAFPGLVVSYASPGTAVLLVPVTLVLLAAIGLRAGASPLRPGDWLTARALREARPDRPGLPALGLRRRLLAETALWIVAVVAWVLLARSSGWLVFGTGLASIAFGAVQALAARARVARAERERGERYVVARRRGLGTPQLGIEWAEGAGG